MRLLANTPFVHLTSFKSKAQYFTKKFVANTNNIKGCWKVINEIRCKQRNFILPNYVSINVADALNNSKYESTAIVPDFKKFLKIAPSHKLNLHKFSHLKYLIL